MDGKDTWDVFEVMLDIVVVNACWSTLEQNETGLFDYDALAFHAILNSFRRE